MNHRIRIPTAVLVGIIVISALVCSASIATAAKTRDRDQRPCVSAAEANHAGVYARRALLERRWEVRGLGERVSNLEDIPMSHLMLDTEVRPHSRIVVYRSCGYSATESEVIVLYNDQGNWYHIFQWIAAGSTLHGHDRQVN